MRAILLVVLATTSAAALEAKWTPASDGGPARFSKKYRDAQGIDDSRWTNDGPRGGSSSWNIFPETPTGWALAIVAGVFIFVMLGQCPPQPWQQGARLGGRHAEADRAANQAAEAAREAFLRKYDQR